MLQLIISDIETLRGKLLSQERSLQQQITHGGWVRPLLLSCFTEDEEAWNGLCKTVIQNMFFWTLQTQFYNTYSEMSRRIVYFNYKVTL